MSVDLVGVLYQAQIEISPEPLIGWHVNVTPDEIEAHPDLAAYVVTPTRLRRVWAGDDPEAPAWTVALRFPDQETADSVLVPQA